MIDTTHDVLLSQTFDGFDNEGLVTVLDESHKLLSISLKPLASLAAVPVGLALQDAR